MWSQTSLLFFFFSTAVVRGVMSISPLVVLCFDGFRWNYVHNTSINLSNFRKLIKNGVTALNGMQSSFPTETFPNHMTLVTGLYPESHGIIANHMYDPIFNETFAFEKESATDPKWYTQCEPVWITNELRERQEMDPKQYKSAVFQWPCSNVMYKGRYPSLFEKKHQPSKSPERRFQQILECLNMKNPPNLIMSYFEEPDEVGHDYGPKSNAVKQILEHYDLLLGKFIYEMKSKGTLDDTNIIVLSDHGMTDAVPNGAVYLNNSFDSSLYDSPEFSAFATIWPKPYHGTDIYNKLKNIKEVTAYKKDEIPERLHYKNHRRIPPILAIAKQGRWFYRPNHTHVLHGCHGYDNNIQDMNAMFIASGPAFKKGIVMPSFSNIHVYSLFCHLLGIRAKGNNGTLETFQYILVNGGYQFASLHSAGNLGIALCFGISIILVIIILVCYFGFRRRRGTQFNYDRLSLSSHDLPVLDSFSREVECDMP